jgi:hypothetical protein
VVLVSPTSQHGICSPRSSTPAVSCWARPRSTTRATRSPPSRHCWIGIDLTGTVITADALHTQDRHATYLHQRGGHYVFIVKNNRPKLRTQLAGLPWRDIPALDLSQDKRHGRMESRTLKLTALGSGIIFPHAQLAAQIVRRQRPNTSAATGT